MERSAKHLLATTKLDLLAMQMNADEIKIVHYICVNVRHLRIISSVAVLRPMASVCHNVSMATPGYKIVGPDGRESSPFDSDALVSYVQQGYIQQQTTVFDPTVGQWIPAGQVAALQGAFVSQPWAAPVSYPGVAGYGTPPAQRNTTLIVALIAGLVAAGVAFVFVGRVANGKQTFTSADGKYTVSVPQRWVRPSKVRPGIVEYRAAGSGVEIIPVLRHQITVDELDRQTARIERVSMSNYSATSLVSSAAPLTVSGYPARQFSLNGAPSGGYVHLVRKTLIDTPDGVYDVTVFARAQNADAQRASQDAIVASFHRVVAK